MCGFRLDFDHFGASHRIDARDYFAAEISSLSSMDEAGAIRIDRDGIEVLPRGRLLVRAVAVAFDRRLREERIGRQLLQAGLTKVSPLEKHAP
ncbi:MAG: hypothetical protein R3E48_14000 [Burkholderiaceae bacterium]